MPQGVDGPSTYHGPLSVHTKPKAPVIDVPIHGDNERYPKLSADRIVGLTRHGGVEFHSWSPSPDDPTRVRFARLLFEHTATRSRLYEAVRIMQALIHEEDGFFGPLVFDGGTGAALYFPFADAPSYEDVRAWLRARRETAAERYPDAVTLEPNTHLSDKTHLHFSSNAVGRFSALPYSARGHTHFPIALPAEADDPAQWHLTYDVRPAALANYLSAGEYFAKYVDPRAQQRFADRKREPGIPAVVAIPMPAQKTHGHVVAAAIAVLQDGRPHSAEDILKIAEQRGLVDSKTPPKYVYTSLIEYIARAKGNGRKPQIVQNADRTFRINEPPDLWPAVDEPPLPPPSAEITALIDRLIKHADGPPAAFEEAVCDAFTALGFIATHLGGQKMPDGYADAPLGPLAYRFTIECKSGGEGINDPGVFEAAKYKDPYEAKYAALVGRAFSGEIELAKELVNHGVSAWAIDDLETLLRIEADPLELEALFAPGFASDALDDLVWERHHGRAKRVRLICDAILRTGMTTQRAYHGSPSQAPRLTEDVLMVLVNQDLAAQGSDATCAREDVRAALEYLANPLVAALTYAGDRTSAVVLG
jgi:DNA primase